MEPIQLKKSLKSLLKKMDIMETYNKHKAVVMWKNVCGDKLAGFSRATYLRGDRLYVVVRNHIWAQEMTMLEQVYIDKYEKLLGSPVVTKIFFQAKPEAFTEENNKKVTEEDDYDLESVELSEEETVKIKKILEDVTDEVTLELAKRILFRAARLEKWLLSHGGRKCFHCGVVIEGDMTYCPVCLRELEKENVNVLFEALERKPWLTYEDAVKTITPLSYGTFSEIKAAQTRAVEKEIELKINKKQRKDLKQEEFEESEELEKSWNSDLKLSILTLGMLRSDRQPAKLTDQVLSLCLPGRLYEIYKEISC